MNQPESAARISSWIEAHRDEMVAALREQLRIPSKEGPPAEGAPFGAECRKALDLALAMAAEAGFRTRNLDGYAGHAEFGDGSEMVMALGHLDVVPEGEGWKFDPYGAEVADGYIYARGAVDDKGPTYAAFFAARAIKELGLPIRRRIRIVFGCNEESGFRCVKHYFEHEEAPTLGFAPDAEWPLIYAEKGVANLTISRRVEQGSGLRIASLEGGERPNIVPDRARATLTGPEPDLRGASDRLAEYWDRNVTAVLSDGELQVTAIGKAAHASTPFLGDNAASRLLRALRTLELPSDGQWVDALFRASDPAGAGLGIHGRDEIVGDLTSNLGILRVRGGVVTALFNIRYPVEWRGDRLLERVGSFLHASGFEIDELTDSKPLHVPVDQEPVRSILAVLEEEFGEAQRPGTMGGGTYARAVPNTVAVGTCWPGDGVAHEPNERYAISSYLRATAIYARILLRLAS
ncbi:MAG: peptidase M20 [Fimbriimonadales bacterium]